MTEKEKQEIINIVHRTILGFFDQSLDEEKYLTETEKTLLEVNKAICNSIKELPTIERPHGEWLVSYECPNCGEIRNTPFEVCPQCKVEMREGEEK
jgi:rubrerythrin